MTRFKDKYIDQHALSDAASSRANALKQKFKSLSSERQHSYHRIGRIAAPTPNSKWLIIAILAAGTLGLFLVG